MFVVYLFFHISSYASLNMRTKSKGVRRYSCDETLEGHGTVGVGLIDVELHLTDGAKSSALVHAAMDEDVFLGPHNGNMVGLMDGLSDFPVFMDVDDMFSRVNAFSEEPITMWVLLLHPSGHRMV